MSKSAAYQLSDIHIARYWSRVQKTDGCWLWVGNINFKGYGRLVVGGKYLVAHRIAYELLKGPIPDGLVIDHLCRVRNCVNPEHLEPVTHRTNILRGMSVIAAHARQTHCAHGHPLHGDNVLINNAGHRRCMTCVTLYNTRRREARHA